jgi:C4-dicarboxylate-binding protein DctP
MLGITAIAALMANAVSAKEIMRCSHQQPPGNSISRLIDRWAKEVEKLSGGELEVQVFPADSLVSARENIVSVAKGSIECAFSLPSDWGKTLPIMSVTMRPYSFADMNIWRSWDGSPAAKFLEDKLREKGVENVAWLFVTNEDVLSSNGHFLKSPADFKGIKFRGLDPAFNASLTALGATPVSMPGSEVYQALASGIIDGGMTAVDSAVSRKYYEIQDHFTITPMISMYLHGYVNPGFYAGLSDKSRSALHKAGAEVAVWAVEQFEADRKQYEKNLIATGASVRRLTEAENAAFEDLMRPAFDNVFKSGSPDRQKLLSLIDQLRSKK